MTFSAFASLVEIASIRAIQIRFFITDVSRTNLKRRLLASV
jgi:hypothetical protein